MIQEMSQFVVAAMLRLGLAVLPTALLLAPDPTPAPAVRNIVLVHSAFADGSSWSKVIPPVARKWLSRGGRAESIDLTRR